MKAFLKILLVILILGGAGAGFYFYKQKSAKNSVSLETVFPSKGDIVQTITATGRLQPIDQVDIGTEVSGTVSKIYTDFNQRVTIGQVLLELDPLKAKVRVEQTKAAYKTAANEVQYQKRNYERTQELFKKGGVPATELETAEYRYKNAQNSLVNARSNLEQAELDLANCTIKSPIDGIVLNRAVEAGQTVAASLSAPTLFTLARDLTQMEVKADVDEADIGQVKTGQRVEFSVDAYPGDNFTGVVQEVRLSPNIMSNVVTYTVVIRAENPDQKLLPGMTANCNIVVEEALQVLTIPLRALQFRPDENTPGYVPPQQPSEKEGETKAGRGEKKRGGQGGKQRQGGQSGQSRSRVWVVDNKGNLKPQPVVLGLSDGTKIQVVEGLEAAIPVAVGVQSNSAEKSANQTTNPFMPQRKATNTRMR
jgi:HlyD family secretion protein